MAKAYVTASSQQHSVSAAPITALPCTIACWLRYTGAGGRSAVSLDTAAGDAALGVGINSTPRVFAAQVNSAGTSASAVGASNSSSSTWLHAAGVFTSDISRTAYMDGVPGTTVTTNIAFTAPDSVRLGALTVGGSQTNYFQGRVAEVGVWSVALTTAQIEMLASGVSPLLVRPDALVFYAPLLSTASAVADQVGGLSLAATNAPTDEDHAPAMANLSVGGKVLSFSSAPAISSTNNANTLIDEASFVITGTALTSATAVTFKQATRPDYVATAFITANDATSVTLTGLDVQDMSMAYGAATVAVTTAAGTSTDFAITIAEQATHQYITLSGHTPGDGWALGEATANSDQLVAPVTTALGGTFAFVGTDGSYTITYGGTAPTNDSAYWAWFDDSSDQWYESIIAINAAAGGGAGVVRSFIRPTIRSALRAR